MTTKKAVVSLSEIYKRVPQNQLKQFEDLSKKYGEYSRKMNDLPNKLPKINWAEYKTRVRAEAKPVLEEFEKKYEELNKMFDERDKLDHSRYYEELEDEKEIVQKEILKFKEESEIRIKQIEEEIKRFKSLKPYKDMTIEELCILVPEKAQFAPYHGNVELFWPFDLETQTPGKPYNYSLDIEPEVKKDPKVKEGPAVKEDPSKPEDDGSKTEIKDTKIVSKKSEENTDDKTKGP